MQLSAEEAFAKLAAEIEKSTKEVFCKDTGAAKRYLDAVSEFKL